MSWFTENPWPLTFLCLGTAMVWWLSGQQRRGQAVLVLIAAAVGILFLERWIVTPGEALHHTAEELLQALIDQDVAHVEGVLAADATDLKETARQGLALVSLGSTFHLQDVTVTLDDDASGAQVTFRANGPVTLRDQKLDLHAVTRWDTTWVMADGAWKLREARRLNPVSGESMGTLDRRQ